MKKLLLIIIILLVSAKGWAAELLVQAKDSPFDNGAKKGDIIVRIDPKYFRPAEVETLLGDPSKAKERLGWIPEINLEQMIAEMVNHDLSQAKQRALLKKHGYDVTVNQEK
jgi:GDPmannose 4,6-dehydratase